MENNYREQINDIMNNIVKDIYNIVYNFNGVYVFQNLIEIGTLNKSLMFIQIENNKLYIYFKNYNGKIQLNCDFNKYYEGFGKLTYNDYLKIYEELKG